MQAQAVSRTVSSAQTVSLPMLLKWSGAATIIAGLGIWLETFFHPRRRLTDVEVMLQETVLGVSWDVAHIFAIIAFTVIIFGLIGLYVRQFDKMGRLGLAGFVLGVIGNVLGVGGVVPDAFIMPLLARDAATTYLLEVPGPLIGGGPFTVVLIGSGLLIVVGAVLFGIAGLRAGVFPAWAWWLTIVGMPLVTFGPLAANELGLVGAALAGLGYVWLGYSMWKNPTG